MVHTPTRRDQEYLICGFIKEQCKTQWPVCLSKVCFKFYNTFKWIKLDYQQLDKLLSTAEDEYCEAEKCTFIYKHKNIHLTIKPVFCLIKKPQSGYIIQDRFGVDMIFNDLTAMSSIEQISYRLKIFCHETNTLFISSRVTHIDNNIEGLEEDHYYADNRVIRGVVHSLLKHQNITFGIDIEILSIKYYKAVYYSSSIKTTHMLQRSTISKKLLLFESTFRLPFISYYNDKSYALCCNDGVLCLHWLKMPPQIKSITISIFGHVLLYTPEANMTRTIDIQRCITSNHNNISIAGKFHTNINVYLHIVILNIVDDESLEEIPKTKWENYGIY